MRKFLIISGLLGLLMKPVWGQVALNNSRTLYDTFENPSQKAFYADTSKRFAFNFGFPTLSINSSVSGSGIPTVRGMLVDNITNTSTLPLGQGKFSNLSAHTNIYLLSFRWFKKLKYQQEAGFSWQIRNDTWAKISNESLAIFDTFTRFDNGDYQDVFDNRAYEQSYHQFAFSYRENLTKTIGLGVKLSLLSGIAYHSGSMNNTFLSINKNINEFFAGYTGKFRSSTNGDTDSKILLPNFKNPGFALTASANFRFKSGWYILANVKDLGFIRWNKKSQVYNFQQTVFVDQANLPNAADRLEEQITASFEGSTSGDEANFKNKAFIRPVNSKIEFLLNKDFGFYRPNLMLSKNIWYPGGQATLINNLVLNKHVFSLSPTYNFFNYVDLGTQYLYKTPNWEFFVGSDQLFKSLQLIKSLNQSDASLLKGQLSAGFYIGFSGKFGRILYHNQNTDEIPGLEPPNLNAKPSFFKKMFGKSK